ncbi:MAG TPA: tetratricopeptide repeat protein [Flavobacterium lutivivi]|nr:tetratricopeptide repeat protein [Flavobacterium lutivivi]
MKTIFKITLFLYSSILVSQNSSIDSLKRILPFAKTDTAIANVYNHLANEYKEINPDTTLFFSKKAFNLSKKQSYQYGIANSYINTGNAMIVLGKYNEAKNSFNTANKIYQEELQNNENDVDLQKGLARTFASLGVIYSQESNYYVALENYQKALNIYQKINHKTSISKALNNIGVVYKSQGNNDKALEYFRKALKIQIETGEQTAPVTMTNIGVIFFEKNDLKTAYSYYKKAENLFPKTNNIRGFALLKNYLGDYYKKSNKVAKATNCYNKSLELYNSIQNKFGASLALYNLGQLYAEEKQYEKAMEYAMSSLNYAKEIGVLDQTYHSEKLVSELYGYLNKPNESLVHYKNYIAARDSITNLENNKKFVEAEMNFEYKKREALLAEQNKRSTQLTLFSILGGLLIIGLIFLLYNRNQVKKRLTLQKEVAEYEQKALHLQMNPHFVFNCLGSISSFIVQNGTDSALKYLAKFSKLMRLTLEYSKGSLIPIDKEIESLQNYLELEQLRFHNKFDFSIKSSEKVEFNMGLPPLLIQPFVENAILHGLVPKEEKGKIKINFDVENNKLICTITDDGIGISKSKQIKENSVKAHKSMALEITKKRLEIMEATISESAQIDIKEDNGTIVTLQLPIQYIK